MCRPGERGICARIITTAWLSACLLLSACIETRPPQAPVSAPVLWESRLPVLQKSGTWSFDGRVAASLGGQGWQAGLTWAQQGNSADLHLSGPLGLGASELRLTPEGLSVDGAPPRTDAAQILQERLGVDLPLASLRYWILGVPDPDAPSTVTRNAMDRVQQLQQGGWTIDIGRYLPVDGDWLPGQLTVQRDQVRVRIAVDHWNFPK
jgi:outer membrane lipoprotein LolB